jgi:DNA polymerase bacteriophage-type
VTKLYIDIETRSRQDLKKVGVYRYAECPDFRILMASWAYDDAPVTTAIGQAAALAVPGLFDPSVEKVAHNAQFERVCFSMADGTGWSDPAEWRDTAALAAEYGHPRSLNGVARSVGAPLKDDAGAKLIRLFCMPRRDGGWNDETTHPMEWLDFIAYCEQDVETLREVDRRLGDWPTPMERRIWDADQRINDNGIRIDADMARLAEQASLGNTGEMMRESIELTGLANPNSVQQLGRWLGEQGYPLPNLRAETVEAALAGELPPVVRQVLEMRLDLALASSSKYATGLAVVSPDERIRGSLRFHGAHTGRWSGRGLQPQNLPRAAFKTEHETEAAILDLKMGLGADPQTLKKLVRALFTGPFTVVDYAAIEARVIAWLAGEEWALQAFRDGRDIYVETAQRMGGLTRSQGKVAVLALGYNGAVNSLRAMGAEGDDEELLALVVQWRRANKRIVKFWEVMQNALEEGGRVGPHIKVTRHGGTVKIHLPSGRALHYHNMRWSRYHVKDAVTGKPKVKEGWRYDDPTGQYPYIGTYGGRLTENVTQAVARDIMGEALVRLLDAGYAVAAHVHDEILVEGEHDVDTISKIMCEVPDWAAGLPVDGEGFSCQRYRKG